MNYRNEDIEFATKILTRRKELNEEEVTAWMREKEHVELLDEIAAIRRQLSGHDYVDNVDKEHLHLKQTVQPRKLLRVLRRWSVAASIILLLGLFAGHMLHQWRDWNEVRVSAKTERIEPGVKAELILSTGERVVLKQQDTSIEGMNETGIRNDSANGLNYTIAKTQSEEMVYNTMRIPAGGFYRLVLSDGSKVWLNSVTELRFPVTFQGEARKVYLTGEAYFEVVHDSEHPFIVATEKGIEVKVYGTEFNVNTYKAGVIQTVLVQGKVGIRTDATDQESILTPGQMAEYTEETGMIRVKDIDPYKYIAWKDGKFVFERETIEEIMERLERWYDVEVFYENELLKQKRFTGIISRFGDIEQVLRLMEGPATLRFDVQGNVITVKDRQ